MISVKRTLAPAAAAIGLLAALAGCSMSSGTPTSGETTLTPDTSSATTDSPATPEGQDGKSSFVDGILTTPESIIKITKVKVIPAGKKGNEYGHKPVIAYWYTTTNVDGSKTDPTTAWIFSFNAFQDNNPNAENKLKIAGLPDDKFLDSQLENIKKGGTVANAVAYELDDTKTPVELVAGAFLGDEIGRMTYKLN